MLLRMYIEHEIDQRAFQFCAESPVNREARTRDFRGALEIENA